MIDVLILKGKTINSVLRLLKRIGFTEALELKIMKEGQLKVVRSGYRIIKWTP